MFKWQTTKATILNEIEALNLKDLGLTADQIASYEIYAKSGINDYRLIKPNEFVTVQDMIQIKIQIEIF